PRITAGVTSHDVVGMLRRRFGERQVGHGGTLDPDATGVLVVAVGMTTKLLRFVEKTTKRYSGEVVLGSSTSTLDAGGDVVATFDMTGIGADEARVLVGDIMQVPPMVSAVRIDGKRLHELARAGIEVERPARPVTVRSFEVLGEPEPGVLAIDVTCSPGTYIRVLADDLGKLLGGGAHLRRLRRTAVGEFTLAEAAPPDECDLLPVAAAVRGLAAVTADVELARLVSHGRVLPRPIDEGDGPWAVFHVDGRLLAVYEAFVDERSGLGLAKPSVVLPSGEPG
ncbi:MAG: tRNA pseudouridine(55) synthase TruB, partial [Ilumatobacteraceae bacterium]